jgi:septal ring factor EnvC (AmiA/AmiB activator)
VRRRAQNREAQRRFRERKEQQKKVLQNDAEELHKDYQTLLKQYSDTAGDLTRLVKENESLRVEVRELRQQWRLLLAVLRLFQGSQLPGNSPDSALPFDGLRLYVEDLAGGIYPSTTRYLS